MGAWEQQAIGFLFNVLASWTSCALERWRLRRAARHVGRQPATHASSASVDLRIEIVVAVAPLPAERCQPLGLVAERAVEISLDIENLIAHSSERVVD